MTSQAGVVEGLDYRNGKPIRVTMANGVIEDISRIEHPSGDMPWLAPGLVDLQVNGYAGFDLNGHALDPHVVRALCRILWQQGVTQFLPTLVTGDDAVILESLKAIRSAVDSDETLAHSVPGIHLEGPFISPEDGPRGAHAKTCVKSPDWDLFCRWQDAAGGAIRLITMSPEWEGSAVFIRRCAQSGVKVAIGHTAANTRQLDEAVDAGATLSTHLGNGAHSWMRRHPNYIWDQLANDRLWASFIADGFHLPMAVMKVVMAVKRNRCFLVSDTVALAGLPPGTYETTVGGEVVLTEEGRLYLAGQPELLAGSVQSLFETITNLAESGLCSWKKAWDLASVFPSAYLGLSSRVGLTVGAPGDLVVYRKGPTHPEIDRTFSLGQVVYASDEPFRIAGGVV